MNAECLIAEYRSMEQAKVALEVLQMNDFASDAVSIAWRGNDESLKKLEAELPTVEEPSSHERHGRSHAVELGALIGSAIALPLSLGSVVLPIMIAGPLLGAATGAFAGGIFGQLNYQGVHSHVAMHYEKRIAEGAVLIIVTSSSARLDEVNPSLKTTDPVSLERFAK